ncbi:hypothetical protein JOB18_034312 [Solea senegalensis]|uniref:Peptidase A2 domain-containing protein n=1 Tax=Solea senegalensis TaxID=28829 RepID=A0AAV6T8R9_SOLSE|nr:hypothetical protein JOB18_034312 [Solea senegalensis]
MTNVIGTAPHHAHPTSTPGMVTMTMTLIDTDAVLVQLHDIIEMQVHTIGPVSASNLLKGKLQLQPTGKLPLAAVDGQTSATAPMSQNDSQQLLSNDNDAAPDSSLSCSIFAAVEGTEVCALIDSGSFVSIVSEDFRNSYPALKKRPMTASSVPARSVNGQCLDILGKLTSGIRLGKQVWQQEFGVLRGAYQPVILGWDFLEKHHALLDVKNKVLKFWDMKIPLLPKGHEVAACCNLSVLAPTRSENLITACVSPATPASPIPTDYCGVLMPNPACDIIVAHSLTEVQNGTTVVRVFNPSRDNIELHSGQHLGEFHSASSELAYSMVCNRSKSILRTFLILLQVHQELCTSQCTTTCTH